MLVMGASAACSDSPTEPGLGSAYLLIGVDGRPVPAAIDSSMVGERRFYRRIVGRSIELVSRDSARYAWATDGVERLPDGTLLERSHECQARMVAYRRDGDRLLLTADAISLAPSLGVPFQPAVDDSLRIRGDRLLHTVRGTPTIGHPEGRLMQLEYRAGRPDAPVCG